MPKFQFTKIMEVAARGGLSKETIASHPDKASSQHTPTRAGRFTILTVEKHISGSRWIWSSIPWGMPMKVTDKEIFLNKGGAWKRMSELYPQWIANYSGLTSAEKELRLRNRIMDYYKAYYASSYRSEKPTSWIFNDFGHISVKYFRDNNNNGIYEKSKDELMSDFIHTTPFDEAATVVANREKRPDNINLGYSHGCIHIKPNDIDRLISLGYVRKGIIIEVHPYSAVLNAPMSFMSAAGKPPHELHFFPTKSTDMDYVDGGGKLVIYKVSKLG